LGFEHQYDFDDEEFSEYFIGNWCLEVSGSEIRIIFCEENKDNIVKFVGTIKNKSELKRILIQIGFVIE